VSGALSVEDVRVTFHRRGHESVVAVDGVSLAVPANGAVGLVGESGCGKSTLARVIAGIQRPDSGTVRFDAELLAPRRNKAQRRRFAAFCRSCSPSTGSPGVPTRTGGAPS
jgi:peptide/nickel transport system ATP-binding protein